VTLTKDERIRKYGEVFTPPDIVAHMCDMLEDESPGAFAPDKTFLEPTCGDGAFVVEILRRKFDNSGRAATSPQPSAASTDSKYRLTTSPSASAG
jgi:hypothetical protein